LLELLAAARQVGELRDHVVELARRPRQRRRHLVEHVVELQLAGNQTETKDHARHLQRGSGAKRGCGLPSPGFYRLFMQGDKCEEGAIDRAMADHACDNSESAPASAAMLAKRSAGCLASALRQMPSKRRSRLGRSRDGGAGSWLTVCNITSAGWPSN